MIKIYSEVGQNLFKLSCTDYNVFNSESKDVSADSNVVSVDSNVFRRDAKVVKKYSKELRKDSILPHNSNIKNQISASDGKSAQSKYLRYLPYNNNKLFDFPSPIAFYFKCFLLSYM